MVVSPNEAVQCTCGRRGARAPQAVADGAACGGTPARETTSSKGQEGVLPGELASGCPGPPYPRPAPQGISEALSYGIPRRLSTDVSQT